MKRLDKIISNNSIYSRKETNLLIKKNKVKVNNVIINKTSFLVNENDQILIDDQPLITNEFVYIVLNKPKNFVCSTNNNDGESVLNLIKQNYIRNIHIVGRLDKDTTGLVLFTNDGVFTHHVKSKKNKIEKEYEVELENNITAKMLDDLSKPLKLDNKPLCPFKISNVHNNKLNITLVEGKYHQVKRIFKIVNNNVINLNRTRIGKLKLKDIKLEKGQYKFIDKSDI